MHLNEAISARIKELCKERNMSQYALSMKSGVPQSTLSTISNCTFSSMKMRIIYEICEGFEITLKDFFDSPLFQRENIID
ncbi:MAG: helix-turn-helix transcriptional regulator [Clostridia bacterium]|nr:helix-turn-helix transcriptional regulator [Clostridia bacterium]